MKILMATNYFASHRGGIEIVAGELYRRFAASGEEVVWIAAGCTPPPERFGASRPVALRVFNFLERMTGLPLPIPTPGALNQIRHAVGDADIVILHDCLYLTNIVAFLIARITQRPTIIAQHIGEVPYSNPVLSGLMKLANKTVTRWMLSRAQQVVFISETTRAFFSGVRYRTPPETVFNGVEAGLYRRAGADEKRELRRQYGLPEDQKIALFVGRFVEKKGIGVLKLLANQRPDIIWVFAGWGPLDPRGWKAANVRVFSGLRGAALAALYQGCDVLVIPSVGEGLPLVVQEALASGLPVVCGSETVAADPDMAPFVRGVPIHLDDPALTAGAVLRSIENTIIAGAEESVSAAARAFASSRYSWTRAAERYLEFAGRLHVEALETAAPAQAPQEVGH